MKRVLMICLIIVMAMALTLPAFAAALALGADEIEFDVRETKDHRLIVSRDGNLERICGSVGMLQEMSLEELRRVNIGKNHGWQVSFCTPEEVFAHLANRITFNIHVKEAGEDGWILRELEALIDRYGARNTAYFAGTHDILSKMCRYTPSVPRTAIQHPKDTVGIYEMATEFGCGRVQFWLGRFDRDVIERLHADGILCNLFHAENEEEFAQYTAMGIDVLLTNRMDLASAWREENAR